MIPDSITKPIMAMILRSLPATNSPISPPVNARGIVNRIMKGDLSDWNCATMIRYINAIARISINPTCPAVSFMDSISPAIL